MSNVLVEKNKLDVLATAISNKSGEPLKLTLDEMVSAVDGIENNPAPTLQTKTYTVDSAGTETITADSGYDGLSKVEVSVPSASVVAEVASRFFTQNNVRKWEVYANAANFNVGYLYYGQVAQDYKLYNAVPSGTTVTPTESAQTIGGADTMMEGAVTVSAIPSNYVGSGITRRSSTDLTVSGATVTVPSGYYLNQAQKSVDVITLPTALTNGAEGTRIATLTLPNGINKYLQIPKGYNNSTSYYQFDVPNGTAGTPTATKGAVSNHSVSVTPSVTNTTGYITGGTKSGTAVTVSASELVSGTKSITGNGTGIDVTNYASVDVAVQSGMDVPVFTVTFNQSTGVATVTCNKTYQQCEDLVFNSESTAVVNFGNGVYSPLEGFSEDGTKVQYFGTEQGVPAYEIVYNANGTITFNAPSSVLDTLNVTANGTYTPPFGKVYNEVVVNVPSGGGPLTVATKTLTNTTTTQTLSFSSLSGQPKYWFLRATTNVSSSGSTTYYYVTDCFYDGTDIKGNTFRIGSTRRVQNITSGISQSYSGNTLTITAGSSSTATPGQFYGTSNFGYELVYIY